MRRSAAIDHARDEVRRAREKREKWDAINAKRGFGWDTNPWVWVVTFRRRTER